MKLEKQEERVQIVLLLNLMVKEGKTTFGVTGSKGVLESQRKVVLKDNKDRSERQSQ